jgi:Tol biopolymer transport system component
MKTYILNIFTLLVVILSCNASALGQGFDPAKFEESLKTTSFKDKFELGNRLMADNLYVYAARVWVSIIEEGKGNGNVNYKAGLSYLNVTNKEAEALPYLKAAEKDISNRYDPFSFMEKSAPIETYYYLGKAYHLNQEIEKAIEAYTTYQTSAHKKHALQPDAKLGLAQANLAKKMISDPKNFTISNASNAINSPYDEYSPVVTLDESTMFFTSRRLRKDSSNAGIYSEQDGKLYEDVYASYKDLKTGEWMEPEILGEISRERRPETNEATISVSGDGQQLFIYNGSIGNGDIYVSQREGDGYSEPLSMGAGEDHADINTDSWETHATISADGRTLYFVSDRPGGLGGRDIYRSVKLPTGQWSKALNIGAPINTPYDEDAPFFHPDGRTLYYSSNGSKSMGGFDIFYSLNIEGDNWSTPFNIGYPLNSVTDDIFFTTTADGQRGYFSSSKDGGVGEKDIYTIDLKREEQAQVAILKGYIDAGADGKIPDGIVIWVTDITNDGEPVEYKPNKRNGAYVFNLEPCHEYLVEYTRDDKTFYETEIQVPCGSGYQEINKVITLDGVALDQIGKPTDTTLVDTTANNTVPVDENAVESKFKYQLFVNDQPYTKKGRVNFMDGDNIVFYEVLDENGFFADKVMPSGKAPVFEADLKDKSACGSLTIKKLDENGVVVSVYNEEIPCVKEVAVQKTSFQKFYGYNEKGIQKEEQRFKEFVQGVNDIIAKRGYANVEVEGSASTVPTKTFRSNTLLAKQRSEEAKSVLLKVLKDNGVDLSKVKLQSVNSVVQGPKYSMDFKKTEKYAKFQYILIKAF